MEQTSTEAKAIPSNIKPSKLKDYKELIKFTLSLTVVFSSVISYLLVPGIVVHLKDVLLLTLGGMLVTGSANAINQITERDTDAMMKRTANRPVAAGRISIKEGWTFVIISATVGLLIMISFNWQSALISAISLFTYAFIYTPLKKVSAISVLVGAFPGAFPCLIGWVAGQGDGSWTGGWILFAIQFIWQFPHFWAIAWVAHKDYTKAGFKLLPGQNEPTKTTALQAIGYSLLMIPICALPLFYGGPICANGNLGMSGLYAIIIGFAANVFLIAQCVRLYIDMDVKAARRVMFSSYAWLPIILLALLAFKSHC
jgi:protoheme IX farnesyltransferase